MDRYAVLMDAGYVLHSAAELFTQDPARARVGCDYPKLFEALLAHTDQQVGLPLLRVYWYDASADGQPDSEQRVIGSVPGVRLRLGRIVRGQQKGVDSRIVRDLIVLSHDRAIATAVLVAGDEDLCEGVLEAEERGVRVVLLGVPGVNQSPRLVDAVDQAVVLAEDFWKPHFTVRTDVTAGTAGGSGPLNGSGRSTSTPSEAVEAPEPHGYPVIREALAAAGVVNSVPSGQDHFDAAAREAGAAFARKWRTEAAPHEVAQLLNQSGWQVPRHIDAQLLRAAEEDLGLLWERPELKIEVRRGFWDELRTGRSEGQ